LRGNNPSGPNVRSGSEADIVARPDHVRFTPESGHWNSVAKCPLCAKSRTFARHGVPKGRGHEVGLTRKLKPYFSKIDFAVRERKNDKYCTASDLAFAVNATG